MQTSVNLSLLDHVMNSVFFHRDAVLSYDRNRDDELQLWYLSARCDLGTQVVRGDTDK
jgi:hypothetical protein